MFQLLLAACGLSLIYSACVSAIAVLAVPRNVSDKLARAVFLLLRRIFDLRLKLVRDYEGRDHILAFYAPLGLIVLLIVWLSMVHIGFGLLFWAAGREPWMAFRLSGSSLLTLGFEVPVGPLETLLAFAEAGSGMILTALLISYLPTIYGAFSRREAAVTMLEVRAAPVPREGHYIEGPPSAVNMLLRYHNLGELETLSDLWSVWEIWFAEIEESHTSLAALSFFRSPRSSRSWAVAAGVVLDAAALRLAVFDMPFDPYAGLCMRAGHTALRHIATFFFVPLDPDPNPDDPISVSRAEFDSAYEQLAAAGLPMLADRDQAWRNFAGWRVNYDAALLALCRITTAPPGATWSSDRT